MKDPAFLALLALLVIALLQLVKLPPKEVQPTYTCVRFLSNGTMPCEEWNRWPGGYRATLRSI